MTNIRYGVAETPPLKELIPLSIQHIFAMFASTILVPILRKSIEEAYVNIHGDPSTVNTTKNNIELCLLRNLNDLPVYFYEKAEEN